MSFIELFMIAVGLSMDAFAVSVCKGLSVEKLNTKYAVLTGCYFGGFQAFMPFLGYLLGIQFQTAITHFDHWIAFVLLGCIGLNMLREAREEEKSCSVSFEVHSMLPLAIATSIDALAVGITFAFLNIHIVPAVLFIGMTTFAFSVCGVKAGNVFGNRFSSKAEIIGGLILIVIGTKILIEHLITEGGLLHG